MKKILEKIIFMVLLIFPISVFASGSVTVSPTSLSMNTGGTKTFTITATNAIGDVRISSSNTAVATVNLSEWETGMVDEGQTKTVNVTVTGVSAGTATITLTIDAASFDEENLSGTKTVNVTVKDISTNNNLSSISIDGRPLSGFSASTTSYNFETEAASIYIGAEAQDSSARVTGTGVKNLSYGSNKIEIKVTAESGNVKTYTINVNRKDTRDTDNFLSNLTVNTGTISFNKNTLNYTLNVENDVSQIKITATPESNKATVTGDGDKTLKLGSNRFEINVTAENGTKRTYVLTVNRKDNRDSNKYLKSLSIDKGELSFDKEKLIYTVNVKNDVEKVIISAEAESTKSSVSGTGEKTLKVGKNEFEIVVTAENESKKTYVIVVNRLDKDAETFIKSLSIEGIDIAFDPNILEYSISITDQTSLKFNYELASGVTATVEGNENLENGSIVLLKLKKDTGTKEYKFTISKKVDVPTDVTTDDSNSKSKEEKKGLGWIIYLIIGLLVLVIVALIYKMLKDKKEKENKVPETPIPDVSSFNNSNNQQQASAPKPDDIEKLDL